MDQQWDFLNIKGIAAKLVLVGILILAGCSSSFDSNPDSNFDSGGIPKQKFLVGGGQAIDWIATTDGTAYLVAENISPRKLTVTKSLKSGDSFEIDKFNTDSDIAQLLGRDFLQLSGLKFSLYFIPSEKASVK
jgi:hypothetical protein